MTETNLTRTKSFYPFTDIFVFNNGIYDLKNKIFIPKDKSDIEGMTLEIFNSKLIKAIEKSVRFSRFNVEYQDEKSSEFIRAMRKVSHEGKLLKRKGSRSTSLVQERKISTPHQIPKPTHNDPQPPLSTLSPTFPH